MIKEMTNNHLEIIYKVMMKRIAKGYSPVQLSFLIGRPQDYVERVEAFQLPCYTTGEISVIALALGDEDYKSYFPIVRYDDMLRVEMEKTRRGNKYHYICYTYIRIQTPCLRFMITEDAPKSEDLRAAATDSMTLSVVQDAILIIAGEGFFSIPRLPLDIFHRVNTLLSTTVNIYTLELAVKWFSSDGDLLEQLVNKQQRFSFRQIFVNSINN